MKICTLGALPIFAKVPVALLVILALGGTALAQDVPPEIRYIRASDSLNEEAKALIRQIVLDDPEARDDLVYGIVRISPGMWKAIGSDYPDGICKVQEAVMDMPFDAGYVYRFRGGFLHGCQPVPDLMTRLFGRVRPRDVRIRKLNREELVTHWGLIPTDIEEPIFTVLAGKRRIVFSFQSLGGRLFLVMLDEMNSYRTFSQGRGVEVLSKEEAAKGTARPSGAKSRGKRRSRDAPGDR